MRQAFINAEGALEASGDFPKAGRSGVWEFPGPESRDMSAKIFGTLMVPNPSVPWGASNQIPAIKQKIVRGWNILSST